VNLAVTVGAYGQWLLLAYSHVAARKYWLDIRQALEGQMLGIWLGSRLDLPDLVDVSRPWCPGHRSATPTASCSSYGVDRDEHTVRLLSGRLTNPMPALRLAARVAWSYTLRLSIPALASENKYRIDSFVTTSAVSSSRRLAGLGPDFGVDGSADGRGCGPGCPASGRARQTEPARPASSRLRSSGPTRERDVDGHEHAGQAMTGRATFSERFPFDAMRSVPQ
jgi:hypothetical protein